MCRPAFCEPPTSSVQVSERDLPEKVHAARLRPMWYTVRSMLGGVLASKNPLGEAGKAWATTSPSNEFAPEFPRSVTLARNHSGSPRMPRTWVEDIAIAEGLAMVAILAPDQRRYA